MTLAGVRVSDPVTRGPAKWPDSWGPAPAWATLRNPDRPTFGRAVADIARLMGTPLFPWQQYVVDVALEVSPDGTWAYDDVLVTAPRRAGKTFLVKSVTTHRCGQQSRESVWMTAQDGRRAVRRWREITDELMGTPLRPGLKRKIAIDHEEIRWTGSGSTFRPFAPKPNAMHGEDPSLVWIDELWAFSTVQRRFIEQGFRPSFAINPGQAWLMSAAGTPQSEWLNAERRAGRDRIESGQPTRHAFFEWSTPEVLPDGRPISALSDPELADWIVLHHPRRDQGLRPEFVLSELTEMGRPDALRAYGNLTPPEDEEGAIPATVLGRARSGGRIPGDARIALGVAVDPDRRDAAIGIAWRDGLGVALTDDRKAEGARWVVGEVVRLVDQFDVSAVAVVAAGPARSVADELERAGVRLLRLSQPDHAAAGARFLDEMSADRPSVTWNGSPNFAAAVAAAQVARKPSGLVWESRTGSSVTPLDARTVAVWAADHAPMPEPRIDPEIW